MLSTLELFIYGFVVLAILPLTVLSLLTGSKPPENTFFTRYYRAERHLMPVGNLFLLALCATAIARLLQQFGVVDSGTAQDLDLWIQVPFFILFFVFLGLFIRAIVKVRRAEKASEQ
jgi:hypothetical protein